jgi:hypothetical protein
MAHEFTGSPSEVKQVRCQVFVTRAFAHQFLAPNTITQLRMEQRYFVRLLQTQLSILTAELCHGFKQLCGVLSYH